MGDLVKMIETMLKDPELQNPIVPKDELALGRIDRLRHAVVKLAVEVEELGSKKTGGAQD